MQYLISLFINGFMIGFVIVMIIVNIIGTFRVQEYTITITDKDRIFTNRQQQTSKYIVWGTDEGGNVYTFQNTDCWIPVVKRNSSDVQGALLVGHTYKLTVNGFRIHLISAYKNILKYEEVRIE